MKKLLKLRAVVSPTPAIIAAAYDENGKADACTLAFYTPTSHTPPCLTIAINATVSNAGSCSKRRDGMQSQMTISFGDGGTLGGPGAPLLVHPLRGQPSVGGYVPAVVGKADTEVGPPS